MLDFAIVLSAMYLFPQFIQNGMGLPVAMAGIIMLPEGIINALTSALSGRLYDGLGASILTRIGFIIAIIGAVLLIFVKPTSSVAFIILIHIILMIGCPLAMSPAQTHALNTLRGPESADGSTIVNTMQQITGAIATALATSFLVWGQSTYKGTSSVYAFTNGVHYGFYFTLALAIIGFILSLTLKSNKSH